MIIVCDCRTREWRFYFWKSRQIAVWGGATRERAMTKATCHEIWKGYARQPVIMSQFPCLAAIPPENSDASIVSCQKRWHTGSLRCAGRRVCGPTLRTMVQFHQAVTQHIFQEGHQRRFVRSGFLSCVTVWSHKLLHWHNCGSSESRHQGKQHLWHKLCSC